MTETNMNTSTLTTENAFLGSVRFPAPGCLKFPLPSRRPGKALPQGEVGVIDIREPQRFKGYWRMPGKENEVSAPTILCLWPISASSMRRWYIYIWDAPRTSSSRAVYRLPA